MVIVGLLSHKPTATEAMPPLRPLNGQPATGTDLNSGRIDFDEWVTLDESWHGKMLKIMGPDAQNGVPTFEGQGHAQTGFL